MHHARHDRKANQVARAYAALKRKPRSGCTTRELCNATGSLAPSTIISGLRASLRARGERATVTCSRTRTADGDVYIYRMEGKRRIKP